VESYVQEKLLICTWGHADFAFCLGTDAFLASVGRAEESKRAAPRADSRRWPWAALPGPQPADAVSGLSLRGLDLPPPSHLTGVPGDLQPATGQLSRRRGVAGRRFASRRGAACRRRFIFEYLRPEARPRETAQSRIRGDGKGLVSARHFVCRD